MRRFLRPNLEWRVLRNLGASFAVAGASVSVWGVLAVTSVSATSVSATATAPDCITIAVACLHDNAGFEGVTATQFGSNCNFETQGTTTDGFHFILPDQGTSFVSLTVWFDEGGLTAQTVTTTTFIQNGKGAVIDVPNGSILLEAAATITGGTFDGTDGGNPFIVLSGTCAGTGGSTTTTPTTTTTTTTPTTTTTTPTTTTTTTTPTTTTTTTTTTTSTTTTPTTTSTTTTPTTTSTTTAPTTTTTTPGSTTTTASGTGGTSAATTSAATNNLGSGVSGAAITSPNTGAAAEGPFGIGLGLVIIGLSVLGLSYRRRDEAK